MIVVLFPVTDYLIDKTHQKTAVIVTVFILEREQIYRSSQAVSCYKTENQTIYNFDLFIFLFCKRFFVFGHIQCTDDNDSGRWSDFQTNHGLSLFSVIIIA